MSNITAIRDLKASGSFVHVHGSGLVPPVITSLKAAGRFSITRTGGTTVYTLKGTK